MEKSMTANADMTKVFAKKAVVLKRGCDETKERINNASSKSGNEHPFTSKSQGRSGKMKPKTCMNPVSFSALSRW